MEIERFASCNGNIEENVSGTCAAPILVAIVPGKKGAGATFIIKIEELYYDQGNWCVSFSKKAELKK